VSRGTGKGSVRPGGAYHFAALPEAPPGETVLRFDEARFDSLPAGYGTVT
jgi:hypothetical protein